MRFAAAVDVITYEFENVPAKTAALLAKRKPVAPDPTVLEITQDRLIEKNFIAELGIATAPYAPVHSASQLAAAIETVGLPAVLKTRHFGYDGKGQAKIAKGGDAGGGVAQPAERAVHPRRLHRLRARGVDGRGALAPTARSNASTSPRTSTATIS